MSTGCGKTTLDWFGVAENGVDNTLNHTFAEFTRPLILYKCKRCTEIV